MNDTTCDELRERIEGELLAVYTIGYDREVADIVLHAKRIIGLVTAARDAEIRELLLSDGAISVMTDGVDRLRYEYRNDLLKVFNYIGLGDSYTGGQG